MTLSNRLEISLLKEMVLQNIVIVKLLAHADSVPVELKTIAASVVQSSSAVADKAEAALKRRSQKRAQRRRKMPARVL